jgi:hypothetical protein
VRRVALQLRRPRSSSTCAEYARVCRLGPTDLVTFYCQSGAEYGPTGMYGSNDAVFFWHGAFIVGRSANQNGDDLEDASGNDHGPHSFGQRSSLWRVHVACQPDGCRRNGRGSRGANTHALHSCDELPLASWLANGSARQHASTQRFQ